ncbi:polysaccharide deacetylase [Purpureocillium lilacinum]|uniref:Polysaccharide deacetylase n=1 Tax=Purpureocillium lilacinum TaxID=33203 RepID=A0A179H972_PURLI|nr:polysaccharide deacetylase [Purpureocillium lilacinum]
MAPRSIGHLTQAALLLGLQAVLHGGTTFAHEYRPEGPQTDIIPRPHLGNVPYGTIIDKCVKPGVVALTFDDGPAMYTEALLNLLDTFNAKATFFVVGLQDRRNIQDEPWRSLLVRMDRDGHHIASHTWTHVNLDRHLVPGRPEIQMMYSEMAFRNIFGWIPTYMRAPYLACGGDCQAYLGERGYHIIGVSLDTNDWMTQDRNVLENSKMLFNKGLSEKAADNGYIVLAHDPQAHALQLASHMLLTAKTRGYKFVTVGECLGDPKENWYRPAPKAANQAGGVQEPGSYLPDSASSPGPESGATMPVEFRPFDERVAVIVSKDGLCGRSMDLMFNYTCAGSSFGGCCSSFGHCGSSRVHCGAGCNAAFGLCHGLEKPPGSIESNVRGSNAAHEKREEGEEEGEESEEPSEEDDLLFPDKPPVKYQWWDFDFEEIMRDSEKTRVSDPDDPWADGDVEPDEHPNKLEDIKPAEEPQEEDEDKEDEEEEEEEKQE